MTKETPTINSLATQVSSIDARMMAVENDLKQNSEMKEKVSQIHRGLYGDGVNNPKGMIARQNDLRKVVIGVAIAMGAMQGGPDIIHILAPFIGF